MLHVGTLAAIVVYYRARPGSRARRAARLDRRRRRRIDATPVDPDRPAGGVATSPLVPLKLFFMKWIEETLREHDRDRGRLPDHGGGAAPDDPAPERAAKGARGRRETTWLDALLIGLAQMFAPLPGVSRSGLTIAAALGLGFSRTWAVGFSLLIAVPAILGAAVFELKDVDPTTLTADRVAQIVAAAGAGGRGRLWGHRLAASGLSDRGDCGIFLYT